MSGFDISSLEEQIEINKKHAATPAPVEEVKAEEPAPEPAKEEPKAEEPEVEDGDEEPEAKEVKPETKAYQRRVSQREVEAMQKLHAVELENARLKALEEARTTQAAKKEEYVPDKDLEPDAYNAYRIQKLEERLEQEATARAQLEQKQKYIEVENLWKQTDTQLKTQMPVYAKANEYLEGYIRKIGKENGASDAEIEAGIKHAEYEEVSRLASVREEPTFIANGLIASAMQLGFNPVAEAKPAQAPDNKPKTDFRELNLHKRNAGSVAAVPTGGGKGRLTAQDVAQMTTFQDLMDLTKLDKSAWRAMDVDLMQ